jgi:signal transduction histidine kinase
VTGALQQPFDTARRRDGGGLLALHVAVTIVLGLAATIVWHASGRSSAWPAWVWFGLAVPAALHGAVTYALRAPAGRPRAFAVHGAVTAVLAATVTVLWPLTDSHAFWPIWPLLGLGALLVVHGIVAAFWPRVVPPTEEALTARVDELTRTRRGALDVQAAELRRIERDLHDGAQARLVALSLQLGRAEERLADRPEEAALVRAAREEASAAIAELRDLARGISPPLLADRGLAAACEGLARRSPVPARVRASLDGRLVPVVETAAYFVVAEGLTNVAKHAPGASAEVVLQRRGDVLVVTVADDGPGGADAAGSGLVGLRRRVEALDGRLAVTSPPGGGTTIRAELPCAP